MNEITLEQIDELTELERMSRKGGHLSDERDYVETLQRSAPALLAAARKWVAYCGNPSADVVKQIFQAEQETIRAKVKERASALEAERAALEAENTELKALVREAAHEHVNCDAPMTYPHEICGKCRACLWLEKVIRARRVVEGEERNGK